jgi:hypothetical protein
MHSSLAEEYYHSPTDAIPNYSSEVFLEGTSPLIRTYIDISTKVIRRKIDNLLRDMGQRALPEITTING